MNRPPNNNNNNNQNNQRRPQPDGGNQRPSGGNPQGGGSSQGGGGQNQSGGQQGGGGGNRNRNRRRRRPSGGGGGQGGGGQGGGSDHRRHGHNPNRHQSDSRGRDQGRHRPSDDVHPLDPMRAIKVAKNAADPSRKPGTKKSFAVLFFDTVPQAIAAKDAIKQKSDEVENLNIVIKAETDRNIPELTELGKVFAGEAWTIIHQRRVADGWYNEPHEVFIEEQASVEAPQQA